MHWRRKWQPTPVVLPGESHGWGKIPWTGSLVGCHLWGRTESDTTEGLNNNKYHNDSNSLETPNHGEGKKSMEICLTTLPLLIALFMVTSQNTAPCNLSHLLWSLAVDVIEVGGLGHFRVTQFSWVSLLYIVV